jgi:hypothetical protein
MKVGDQISCYIDTSKPGCKLISSVKTEEQEKFEIIRIYPCFPGSDHDFYMILLSDDYRGWKIDKFNTLFQGVDEKYLGKIFYDITEAYFVEKEKK